MTTLKSPSFLAASPIAMLPSPFVVVLASYGQPLPITILPTAFLSLGTFIFPLITKLP
jgi:hypothetical protein